MSSRGSTTNAISLCPQRLDAPSAHAWWRGLGDAAKGANLTGAILDPVNLLASNLTAAKLREANLADANLRAATMPDGTIHD